MITDPAYLLCWHDRDGIRPWPVEHKDLSLTISGLGSLGNSCRVWVASPDYQGGAMQEITDYTLTSSTLRLTLPALQFWTMIVIEPESLVTALNTLDSPSQSVFPSQGFTLSGMPATSNHHGIVVQKGRKTLRH